MFKKKSHILIAIIAVIAIVAVIFMLIPDDEDEYEYENDHEYEETYSGTETGVPLQSNDAGSVSAEIEAVPVSTGADSATVMIYLNGSDLESNAGEATTDITEMLRSGVGKNVNVIVQTMGTREWQDYGISSKTAQTYKVENGDLKLIRDDLGQLDCTSSETLSEFVGFCKDNYPADRYFFIFWDHGGG
ncbi:MAG: hypothetical protein IKS16_02260, partial [Lachnospiraceae bacterium]|nr:hypothetical protein [Lachnospiraceae bacterium]